jgi:hypothetical protein
MVRRWLGFVAPFSQTRRLASGFIGHPGHVLDARQMFQEPEWLNRLKFTWRFIQAIGVPNQRVVTRAWGFVGLLLLVVGEAQGPLRLWYIARTVVCRRVHVRADMDEVFNAVSKEVSSGSFVGFQFSW